MRIAVILTNIGLSTVCKLKNVQLRLPLDDSQAIRSRSTRALGLQQTRLTGRSISRCLRHRHHTESCCQQSSILLSVDLPANQSI